MKNLFRVFTSLLFATALLVACGGGTSSGPSSGPSVPRAPAQDAVSLKTTVLVYMIGADLESGSSQASKNIDEMMNVGSSANMTVILQTGGANKPLADPVKDASGPTRVIDWKRVQRYQVKLGTLFQIADLGPDAKDTALDMGSKVTLQSFLEWGVKTYPADKYIVVLWDHGGGINGGIGQDEMTKSALSVPVIQESLKAVSQANKITFEMVGFDACLMATAEVAASLAASSKYMVASQDLEPGAGWAWDRFLRFATNHPAANGKEIGVAIADSYLEKMESSNSTVTLSVIDLSKMAALSAATDGFATALQKYTTDTPENLKAWKQIAYARAKSLDWYTAAILERSTDLVDMVSFPANVVTHITKLDFGFGLSNEPRVDQPLMDASDAVYKALSAAVVYKVQNGSNLGASGLSIYFPSILAGYGDSNHKYASNTISGDVVSFASKYTDGSTGFVKTYYDFYVANKDKLEAQVTMAPAKGNYAAVISNDFAMVLAVHQTATCRIDQSTSKTEPAILETPCFDAMQLNENFTQDTTGQWDVGFSGTQSWVLVGDSGYAVAMIPDEVASVSSSIRNRSLVPAYYYDENDKQWGLVALSVEEYVPEGRTTAVFRVLGYQGTPGSSSNPDKVYPITDGMQLALGAYYRKSSAFYYSFGRTDRPVTVSGGSLNLKRGPIPSTGNFGYIVTDLTGNVSESTTFVPYLN